MKGLKPIAAALVLALSFALVGAAAGEPHGRGGEGWGRGGGPPPWSHAGGRWGGAPPGRWAPPPGHWAPRPEPRGRWEAPPRPYGYGYEGRYAPPPPFLAPRAPAPGYALRRGGRVPPQAWNYVIPDYGRHRLRPPPPGYSWVLMGDRYMLVSRRTGQIFDVIGR